MDCRVLFVLKIYSPALNAGECSMIGDKKNVVCIKCGSLLGGTYTRIFDLYRIELVTVMA
jgi:hypothetical protein